MTPETPDPPPVSPTFRAGDTVKHAGTGETWVLACDQEREWVTPAGWPECQARAADCTLVDPASDAERIDMLTRVSKPSGELGYSYRRSLAAHQLSQEATHV